MSRPEDQLPPDLFYNDTEARKYTTSSRIRNIQAQMTYRALELLALPSSSLVLDIGCGSGLSGSILSAATHPLAPGQKPAVSRREEEEEDIEEDIREEDEEDDSMNEEEEEEDSVEQGSGHTWIGMDISASMLAQALSSDVTGDLFLADMGQGIPFRPGTFDAAISISAIQWLCNAETSAESPEGRLKRFFDGLFVSLKRGGRAVCQFYPRDARQRNMISSAAVRAGFGAGLLEDDPETKSAKTYLVLTVGGGEGEGKRAKDITGVVEGMDGVDVFDSRRKAGENGSRRRMEKGDKKGSKGWIMKKKHQMERQGKVVKADSKYTGRKRRIAF